MKIADGMKIGVVSIQVSGAILAFAASAAYAQGTLLPGDIASGLQAHYCFEAALAADCSGHGSNGTAFGNVTAAPGRVGQGANFGGFDSIGFIHVPNTPRLALTSDFTIAYWAKLNSFHGEDPFAQRREYGFQMPLAKSHDRIGGFTGLSTLSTPAPPNSTKADLDVVSVFRTTGDAVSITYRSPQYTLGEWLHVAYTFSNAGRTLTEYVNGVLVAQLQLPAGVSFTSLAVEDLYLGAQSPLFGEDLFRYPFAGVLDEVRIYDRELSLTAVQVLAEVADRVPDSFAFLAQSNIEPGTVRVSNEIELSGFDVPVPIAVSGGEYSVNSAGFTAETGTANPGDRVAVRHTATTAFTATTTTSLEVGGIVGEFQSATRAADAIPDAFAFPAQIDVELESVRVSGEITVSGIEVPVPIAVSGGSYSVNGGAFVVMPTQVSAGDRVRVRHTASSAFSTEVVTVLTIGEISGGFSSRTLAADTTPDAFHFEDKVVRTPLLPRHVSNAITVTGINTTASISVTGGPDAEYSVNGRPFTSMPGQVVMGDRVRLRNRIPLLDLRPKAFSVDTMLTIGGVSDVWTISLLP